MVSCEEEFKLDVENMRQGLLDDVGMMADLSGIHIPLDPRQSGSSGSQERRHHLAWSPFRLLRAAFTPVSAVAFDTVMGCGHGGALDARAAVANAVLDSQEKANSATHDT